ncbi:MAG: hypothetical protein ACI83W_001698 [Marinoscillum sp.]|jgi:hypothetical protein
MNKDYSLLLENLLGRRYDEARRESVVSDAFETCDYPDSLRYVLESMEEIDTSYVYKTFHVAKKIQEKIETTVRTHSVSADFRYQGAVQTETNIALFGGVELLVLSKSFGNKPWDVVAKLAREIMEALSGDPMFQSVDYSNKLEIRIKTVKPSCEIKILPAVWIDNPEYLSSKREIDRGICEYNLTKKTRRKYLPFLNIARVNSKDSRCNGGLKKMIRLLRSLQRDAAEPIHLNAYQISSMLYAIPDKQLKFNPEFSLSLIGVVSAQLNRVIADANYRKSLISPSEKELVFGNSPSAKEDVQKLKNELDAVVSNIQSELKKESKTMYSPIRY